MHDVFQNLGLDLIRDQVKKHEFKAELIRPLERSLDQLWEDLWKVQSLLDSEPRTLLHGDPHIGNTYLLPDGSGGLLDWQLMVTGSWAHDLTYVMITALDPEERRKHERELIAIYRGELGRRGVAQPPGEDEAWQLYRQTVVWGLVIGWLITPPQNYGPAITAANLFRIVTAAQDLETFRALP
jgi:aminoglycoside phosphotransferase (APT) family kinase protein